MKLFRIPTTASTGKPSAAYRSRKAVTVAFVALAASLWFFPARAQEHTAPAAGQAPAATAPAAPGGEHAPAASGNTAPAPGEGTAPVEGGGAHGTNLGPAEHGPGTLGSAPGGEHETGKTAEGHAAEGQPAGEHAAEGEHAAGGEHAEGGHGEGGEHGGGHKQEPFKIHLGTWLTGPLKQIWYKGPATLNADGAVTETHQALSEEQLHALAGQTVGFKYEDHHSDIKPAPTYDIQAKLGHIGSTAYSPDAETQTVQVNGQNVVLITPHVEFALEKLFSEALIVSLLTALTIAVIAIMLARNLTRVPSKRQAFLEMAYSQLDTFVRDLIGPTYKKYVPLIGTAFLYIFFMNAAGLIPGWMSPTSNINITAGLALVVVVYTQIEGIRVNGVVGYLKHFMGEPWWLFWLNFPIHVIGELAKLLSLTIRLFGNIFGEDVVIVILIALSPSIVPLPAPMYFFGIFTSLVQALVFSILTSVYIALMTVHDEGHGEHGHEDHGHGHGGHEHAHAH